MEFLVRSNIMAKKAEKKVVKKKKEVAVPPMVPAMAEKKFPKTKKK